MYLRALLMFSLMGLAEASNRFSEPDFKSANFAKAINDQKLNGSVLRDFEVASEISCQFECVSEDRCLSYNFLPIHDKETSRCQLSGSDRFVSKVNFTKEDGALYRGIQVTKLMNSNVLGSLKCLFFSSEFISNRMLRFSLQSGWLFQEFNKNAFFVN